MSEKIEAALTPEEWATGLYISHDLKVARRNVGVDGRSRVEVDARTYPLSDRRDFTALIALANAALPESDPRKITRADVEFLRSWQKECADSYSSAMEFDAPKFKSLADALESLLPPIQETPER